MSTKIKYFNNTKIIESIGHFNQYSSFHNEDGAAYIEYHSNGNILLESYYINGIRHRENGAAHIRCDFDGKVKTVTYFLDDVRLTEEEFKAIRRDKKLEQIL
jgi:antitoxin component YwqK of YwqJK toxin-antitoxin module